MTTIVSITFVITLLSIAIIQMLKNNRTSGYVDVKSASMPRILCALSIMYISCMFCKEKDYSVLLFNSVVAVVSVAPLLFSLHPSGKLPFSVASIPVIIPAVSLYYMISASGVLRLLPPYLFIILSGILSSYLSAFFVYLIWKRIKDVKSVMKSGNVWSYLLLCVDFVYVLAPIFFMSVLYPVYILFPDRMSLPIFIIVLLFLLKVVAIAVRVSYSSAFAVMHDHERIIVESMKLSHMDVSAASDGHGNDPYKELYDRIVLYFEMSKPYLDGDLTINDIVKVVYSNKVYISRAICHYTGRNFRQFVNYYRIMYSMALFRENLEFKVAELAEKSGFNTVVSYTMAFRLFMDETPSEWCRKERSKILKTKK